MNVKHSKYIPKVADNCNKYTRGHVSIYAGSTRYPGAAYLCARSASRAGAGYVDLNVPEPLQKDLAIKLESVVVGSLPVDEKGELDASSIKDVVFKRCDSILTGPGFCSGKAQVKLLKKMLKIDVPLVIDADMISVFEKVLRSQKSHERIQKRKAPIVLTPHAGELKHLLALGNNENINAWTEEKLVSNVQLYLKDHNLYNVVVVAKGPNTSVITCDAYKLITCGTSSLASAGTGDCLAGCVASFLAQGDTSSIDVASNLCAAAVETHAYAGLIAAMEFGKRGVMAGDVADALGLAIDALIV